MLIEMSVRHKKIKKWLEYIESGNVISYLVYIIVATGPGLLLKLQELLNEDHPGRGKTVSVGASFDAGNVMQWGPICRAWS